MDARKYYEAYDDRYRQVHGASLRWSSDTPSPVVAEILSAFSIAPSMRLLELGCGEGRDARPLLEQGYNLLATDISSEAISYCRQALPQQAARFQVLDCVNGRLDAQFDFIFAVAVLHMLVLDADRAAFYRFIRTHLAKDGIALICTMGDGQSERQSDIRTAFSLQPRTHQETGRTLLLAGTSCRMVSFDRFLKELRANGLAVCRQGLTAIEPDFPQMMYAVVRQSAVQGQPF